MRLRHDYVMFKTLFADVTQHALQVGHFGHSAVAKRFELVVREFAFADVATDFALGIGGGDATVGQRAGGRATVERAVGVLHAENAAEDWRGGNLDVGQEGFRPVAAVE